MKRNGVKEWIFQRISDVMIFAYAIFYLVSVFTMENVDYESWTAFHQSTGFKLYSTITLVVVMLNSLLAGWQIGTDYTQKVPVAGFSAAFHTFYTVVTAGFLLFGLYILWGMS